MVKQLNMMELIAGLDEVRQSPKAEGVLEMIVRRPEIGEREVLHTGELHLKEGLRGDNWSTRGKPHPDTQLNIMNARTIALVAQSKERWKLAGDQLFIDLDLSEANLPPGSRLAVGTAIIEVTDIPHTGCGKFVERFGADAMKFVNSTVGRELHLRGINAKVWQAGVIRVGDKVTKL
jgi:MOSC domain-containing protein YiiM